MAAPTKRLGCAQAFTAAIAAARAVFDMGAALGFRMRLLDLGGGFVNRPGPDGLPSLGAVPAAINAALDAQFPEGCGVRVIAEPGRCVPGNQLHPTGIAMVASQSEKACSLDWTAPVQAHGCEYAARDIIGAGSLRRPLARCCARSMESASAARLAAGATLTTGSATAYMARMQLWSGCCTFVTMSGVGAQVGFGPARSVTTPHWAKETAKSFMSIVASGVAG